MTTNALGLLIHELGKNPSTSEKEVNKRVKAFKDKYMADTKAEERRPQGGGIADLIDSLMRAIFKETVGKIPVIGDFLDYDTVKTAVESIGNIIGDKVAGYGFVGSMTEMNPDHDEYLTSIKNKHISKLIIETLSNPQFITYAIDNIPADTAILDAVKMYIRKARRVEKERRGTTGWG